MPAKSVFIDSNFIDFRYFIKVILWQGSLNLQPLSDSLIYIDTFLIFQKSQLNLTYFKYYNHYESQYVSWDRSVGDGGQVDVVDAVPETQRLAHVPRSSAKLVDRYDLCVEKALAVSVIVKHQTLRRFVSSSSPGPPTCHWGSGAPRPARRGPGARTRTWPRPRWWVSELSVWRDRALNCALIFRTICCF